MSATGPATTTTRVAGGGAAGAAAAGAAVVAAPQAAEVPIQMPGDRTLQHAFRMAVKLDHAVMCDYWQDSLNKKVFIGINQTSHDQILVKDAESYTSPIKNMYKIGDDLIIVTENSLYIVSKDIPKRPVDF